MRRRSILAIIAFASCGEPARAEPLWVDLGDFRVSAWGSPCGARQAGERGAWFRQEWSSPPGQVEPPLLRCRLVYRPFGRQLEGVYVSGAGVSRAEAEQLVDALIVRYVAGDVGLMVRGAISWGDGQTARYRSRRVELEGRWEAGPPHHFAVGVAVPGRLSRVQPN